MSDIEKFKLATIVILVSIVSLVATAIMYWLIMRQDATVLTAISSAIGGIIGYYFKILTESMKKEEAEDHG
ncbi:MAG: hypothetical protein QXE66_02350 [Desulfurococcaceae archaeon]